MATSGTATFDMDLVEVGEEAFERAGREMRSGYDLRTMRRSLNLLFADWANRGVNLWTLEQGSTALVNGTASYTLPADTVDIVEHVIRDGTGVNQADMSITRLPVSTYAALTNKNVTGRPVQIYVDRQRDAPVVYLWPVPSGSSYTLVYWRMRRIEDAGNGSNTMDVPFRFLNALVAGLAYYIALKLPEGQERLPGLKAMYDEAWMQASTEDRDRSSVFLTPRVSM